MSGYSQVLQKLWTGRCDIYVESTTVNEANGKNERTREAIFQDLPCRLSFSSSPSTVDNNGAAEVIQTIKVFLDKSVEIPPGSRLVITQNGVTECYEKSGQPAIYSAHQEINLERVEDWA